jgi:hypothetical protein
MIHQHALDGVRIMHEKCLRERQGNFRDRLFKEVCAPALERVAPQSDQEFDQPWPRWEGGWRGRPKSRFVAMQHGQASSGNELGFKTGKGGNWFLWQFAATSPSEPGQFVYNAGSGKTGWDGASTRAPSPGSTCPPATTTPSTPHLNFGVPDSHIIFLLRPF